MDNSPLELSTTPVWRSSVTSQFNQPVDVVIVGGGLTGLSAAYHLLKAQPTRRVVVLESQTIGFGASSRNSGMLTPGVGQNLAAMVKRYGREQAAAMYQTSLQAVEYVQDVTRNESIDAHLQLTGQLVIARGRSGRNRLEKQASLMNELSLPCMTLDDKELASQCTLGIKAPGLGPAALRLPIAGVLDPGRLVHGLADAVRRLGGTIIEHAKVSKIKSGMIGLSDGGWINAKKIVVATNGYDLDLGIQRGRLIPIHLRMILTAPLNSQQLQSIRWRGGVIDSRRVFNYFRLTEDNRLLLGGGLPRYRWQGSSQDLPADSADFDRLVRDRGQIFPHLSDVEITRTWTGVIAYSLDTLPVIGRVAGQPNVFQVGGWCGHGIALSVYSGRWVNSMISGETLEQRPWFRDQAPRVPTELGRWSGTRLGGWATQMLDQVL